MAGNSELTNEATKLIEEAEKTAEHNVQKSIKLIKKAIKIRPDYLLYEHFLLANYLTKSGKFNDAHKVFGDIIGRLDINNIYSYNLLLSEIYEKKCNLFYSKKRWEEFVHYYLLADYNKVLGLCSQGKGQTMLDIIEKSKNFDEYFLLNNSKLNSSLKNCYELNDKEVIFLKHINYLKNIIPDLNYLIVKGDECFNFKTEYDSKAKEIYIKFNGKDYIDYLNNTILI